MNELVSIARTHREREREVGAAAIDTRHRTCSSESLTGIAKIGGADHSLIDALTSRRSRCTRAIDVFMVLLVCLSLSRALSIVLSRHDRCDEEAAAASCVRETNERAESEQMNRRGRSLSRA